MIFVDFPVNSQPIIIKFYKQYLLVLKRVPRAFCLKIVYSLKVIIGPI